ncbi:MAG TPA: electron transfer flavoprotein subunit alpha/FixB family protein, partial [Terriglobales bacterium]
MADTIVVVVEQREGKLNRVSWETLVAGQKLAVETGWALEAAVVGAGVAGIAREIAGKKVSKVYDVEANALESYTPDAFSAALKQFLESKQPRLVLMPHTYQVRDFIPKLAIAMGRTVISDCIGFRKDGEKILFTRQMFQGKFAADVSFTCDAPWFVTFQSGAFRGDQVEASTSAAPVETVNIDVPANAIRTQPQPPFKEAKQAVDLTQAEVIVSVGRG